MTDPFSAFYDICLQKMQFSGKVQVKFYENLSKNYLINLLTYQKKYVILIWLIPMGKVRDRQLWKS